MTEAEKDALLVRAALDIMVYQSQLARLREEVRWAARYREMVQRACRHVMVPKRSERLMSLDRAMRLHVLDTYDVCGGDIVRAAKILNVARCTVYRYLPAQVIAQRKVEKPTRWSRRK